MWQEWKQIEIDIEAITDEIENISKNDTRCRQLRQIPGFGPLVSTATVAAIGDGAPFVEGATSQRGWEWCLDSTLPVASRNCTASASAVTSICVAC
jgi:transposase